MSENPSAPALEVEVMSPDELVPTAPGTLTSPIARQIATINEHWRASEHHYQQSCAHLIMAGHQLLDLKRQTKHGEWGKLFDEGGKSEHEFRFGFSVRWAARLMEMAKASKQHLPELAALPFDQPLAGWKEDSLQTLRDAVSKKANGETFQQLAFEWGVSKKSGTDKSAEKSAPEAPRPPAETLTPEELQKKEQELAHKEAIEIAGIVDAFMKSKKPTILDKTHHAALHGAISLAASTLKKISL